MRVCLPLAALALVLAMGCSESDETGADSLATIHGTVTLTGDWPAAGAIQVSLFSTWHEELPVNLAPQGPPDYYTEALNSPDISQDVHVLEFTIADINPGTYPCLAVGWRNGGQMGLDEPVLGLFGADFAAGDTLPESITLSAGQDLHLDFAGSLALIPVEAPVYQAQVNGALVFPDGWPDDYTSYFVVLMTSGDPAAPSQPLAMESVSAADAQFMLSFQATEGVGYRLAVYGYPYGGNPYAAFYGGYGWDWAQAQPALAALPLTEEDHVLEGLIITCRGEE